MILKIRQQNAHKLVQCLAHSKCSKNVAGELPASPSSLSFLPYASSMVDESISGGSGILTPPSSFIQCVISLFPQQDIDVDNSTYS